MKPFGFAYLLQLILSVERFSMKVPKKVKLELVIKVLTLTNLILAILKNLL